MRSEQEIKDKLDECSVAAGWGMSEGPCPFDEEGEEGCCAECSFPSAMLWVLGISNKASANAQEVMINALGSAEELDD